MFQKQLKYSWSFSLTECVQISIKKKNFDFTETEKKTDARSVKITRNLLAFIKFAIGLSFTRIYYNLVSKSVVKEAIL